MYDITILDSVDSTNEYAKVLAKDGANEKKTIIARHQTKGKGRNGRSFFSPENEGLYMSVILRPTVNPSKAVYITALAALAVSEAIDRLTGLHSEIKWVNDVYINGKKVCGILTEGAIAGENRFAYSILGIGVNVQKQIFPEDLQVATSIFNETDINAQPDFTEKLAEEILDRFFEKYDVLNSLKDSDDNDKILYSFVKSYRERSFLIGRSVNVFKLTEDRADEVVFSGTAVDIDRDFKLIVKRDDGETEAVDSGEVRARLV